METKEKRENAPAHSVIFSYWRNKAITSAGEVVEDDGRCDVVPVVEYITEPSCWACGKHIWMDDDEDYLKYVEEGKFEKIYVMPKVKHFYNRCHIIPHTLGGADQDPSNFFLLCEDCHVKSPDTSNPKVFMRWIYKQRHNCFCEGHNVTNMIQDVIDECNELGLDPFSGDFTNIELMEQCRKVSDSSYVYGYTSSCKPISENKGD